MMNQASVPAYIGDIPYFLRVLLFISFLSMGYELSRPTSANKIERDKLLSATTGTSSENKEWPDLPPWQRKASEKAIERYAAVQEKKWRHWNEAMFEESK